MRCVFKSRKRLGDVLLCLPGCLHLARQGHEVWIDCPPQWHPILDWISYAKPWREGSPSPRLILDINRIEFNDSRSSLNDYICDAFPQLRGAPKGQTVLFDRKVDVPDYGLPRNYTLISPFGYSQPWHPPLEWFIEEVRRRVGHTRKLYCLSDRPLDRSPIPVVTASSVAHLPRLIADAEHFFTVNSSPAIIAGAIRNRPYFQVKDSGYNADVDTRVDYESPHRILVRAREESAYNGKRLPKTLVAIPTLTRSDLLLRCKAFLEGIALPDRALVLDNGNQEIDIDVEILRTGHNLGVAGSWNFFLRTAFVEGDYDLLVILQDDILWDAGRLEAAKALVQTKPEVDLFLSYLEFSVQIHRRTNLKTIGFYDERFCPAWCEDDDYALKVISRRRVYQRFHALDPLPGSLTLSTPKSVDWSVQHQKLLDKWVCPPDFGVNKSDKHYFHSSKGITLPLRERTVSGMRPVRP